jgi:hypothetical protein
MAWRKTNLGVAAALCETKIRDHTYEIIYLGLSTCGGNDVGAIPESWCSVDHRGVQLIQWAVHTSQRIPTASV